MRKMSLRGGEMKVILMAKGRLKPGKVITVDRAQATAKENMEAVVITRNRALREDATPRDNVAAQSRWVRNPQL